MKKLSIPKEQLETVIKPIIGAPINISDIERTNNGYGVLHEPKPNKAI